MTRHVRRVTAAQAAAALVGWSIFLPVGVKYPILLGATAWGLWQLRLEGRFQRLQSERAHAWAMMFWGWSALTLLWSAAPWTDALAQLGLYALMLCVPVAGQSLSADWAHRALRHFCLTAGLVGVLCVLHHGHLLPAVDSWVWRSTVMVQGNQRIVTSLLLALGCALALREALLARQDTDASRRWVWWCAVAFAAAAGLASQDRRTGMVTLPILLALLALGQVVSHRSSVLKKLAVVGGPLICCLAIGMLTPGVHDRFAEGWGELSRYNAQATVADSWGMRLRMVDLSVQMAAERPLTGHGLGSWTGLWAPRVPPGSLLSTQRTPHSEYLLVAVQTGLPGVALLLVAIWAHATRGLRPGKSEVPPASLLVWAALAWAGLFNVVLRDGKFAVPLLLLGALAWAGSGVTRKAG